MKLNYNRALKYKSLKILLLVTFFTSCEKFVEVDEVRDQMLAVQVFKTNSTANSAILGLYRSLRDAFPTPFIALNSIYANEIMPYSNSVGNSYFTFNLQPNDNSLPWSTMYSIIYASNNAIEQLGQTSDNTIPNKAQYISEAKFVRALCHFYMLNLYGEVPLILTTDLKINSTINRSPLQTVYDQIILDLKEAKANLPNDYNHSASGERTRANKWAAAALLARVYLYQKEYAKAEIEANEVIGSGRYSLLSTPAGIFGKNNNEAILQFANTINDTNNPVTSFIYTSTPAYICTPILLSAFEIGDLRKTTWIRNTTFSGQSISVPFKFTSTATNPPEYNTMLRLAEVYLIRAEAKSMRDDFQGCVDDINLIRLRHGGLTIPKPAPASREMAITILLQERQVDLFTEGCHRFFDLKRTGRIDDIMKVEKPSYWKSNAALYPIPSSERQRNPNLTQNLGYE